MKKEDLISIAVTAAVGLLAGSYLYLTSFAGILNKVFSFDAESVSEFTVMGDLYGGCSNACPSFQVTKGGSYNFVYPQTDNYERIKKDGNLSIRLLTKLRKNATEQELVKQSAKFDVSICDSDQKTNEAVYRITVNGELYILDSCKTKVNKNSDLWKALRDIWEYVQIDG